jgi:transcriptional regulator with XRE-family HTH domain
MAKDEEPTPTLKEWRELREITLEELAERTGIPLAVLERWEEIGIDAAPYSREADFLRDNYLSVVLWELGASSVTSSYTPTNPEPGQLIIESPEDPEVMDFLLGRAKELGLRVAVPTEKWGTVLKDAHDLTGEDAQAIADHQEAEAAHHEERLKRIRTAIGLLEGHEEDTTLGEEALDAADEELERDLKRLSEGEEE